uniref:Uncharacterized protein n=1 Tax=Rhizophora mucronata TaxID=61149 RepID=A0A2P2MH97_RHIMU
MRVTRRKRVKMPNQHAPLKYTSRKSSGVTV